MMTNADEKLWRVADVAEYLQVSTSLVYKRAEDGTMPCLRILGSLRFDPAVIRKWARGDGSDQTSTKVVLMRRPGEV